MNGISSVPNASGVFGLHNNSGTGVTGKSVTGFGVDGVTDSGFAGVHGTVPHTGVFGQTNSDQDSGVFGTNDGKGNGVAGISANGIGVLGKGGSLAGFFDGNVLVNGDISLGGQDCAEQFDIAEAIEPGTVVVIDQEGSLRSSQLAYDKKVAGVVAGARNYTPGIVLGRRPSAEGRALVGKVYCKADAQYMPIQVGDLLTTSPTPGHAMKAEDPVRAFGSVIGKALRPLTEGQALIPILIALQ